MSPMSAFFDRAHGLGSARSIPKASTFEVIRSHVLTYLALIGAVVLAILVVVLVVRRRRRRHGRRPSEEEMESIRENRRMMREQQPESERGPRR